MSIAVVIFAKAPLPGYAKTRLVPALGEKGAARLAQRLLDRTLNRTCAANIGPVELCVAPDTDHPCWQNLPQAVLLRGQGEGDLGERMARAAQRTLAEQGAVLLIGTDCPALDSALLRDAAAALQSQDAVMVPALDGGYVLLGLNRFAAELFSDIPWSTGQVAPITRERLARLGWSLYEMEPLPDIDEPGDLIYLPDELPRK